MIYFICIFHFFVLGINAILNTKYCTKTQNIALKLLSRIQNVLLKVLSHSQKYLSQILNMGKSIFENIPNGYSTQTCMPITQKNPILFADLYAPSCLLSCTIRTFFSAFFAVLKFFLNFHVTIKKLHLKFVYGQLCHTKVAA